MSKKLSLVLAIIAVLIFITLTYLVCNQVKIKNYISHEPVTDTMVFSEGMTWVTPVPIPDTIRFAGEDVPLHIFYVKEQLDRELTVNTYWHSSTLLMLKRAARWFPVIEPILKEQGIPEDFKYLALIESSLMNVVSPSGAAGFWQFLEKTGKEYGLEIDREVDERYHAVKATAAACRYNRKAYERLGSWTLVAASYNAGQRRISQAVEDQGTRNYYEMYLSDETSRYVFRALAVKLIYESPEKYGFKLQKGDLYDPHTYRVKTVNSTIHSLPVWAIEHGISYRMLKELNPWLRSDKLTVRRGNSYQIALPMN